MITTEEIHSLLENGSAVLGQDGEKLGKVSQVFLDDRTGRPEWATIAGGLFDARESFVPLAQATVSGGDVRVPWSKAKVKDAPAVTVDRNGHISEEEEEAVL
jgi:sporulation protein YlmC with PRC-barrel domain